MFLRAVQGKRHPGDRIDEALGPGLLLAECCGDATDAAPAVAVPGPWGRHSPPHPSPSWRRTNRRSHHHCKKLEVRALEKEELKAVS